MLARGIGEVGDGGADDRLVGDVEIDVVVRAESRGAPVDLDDLGVLLVDLQPVAGLERFADFQRDARDDVAEQILHREADDADDDGRTEDHALDGIAVNAADDDEDGNDEKNEARELGEEFRSLRVLVLFKPDFPVIAPHECQDENRAEEDVGGAERVHCPKALGKIRLENFQRQPDRKGETEKLVERAEMDAGAALEKPPKAERHREQQRNGDGLDRD